MYGSVEEMNEYKNKQSDVSMAEFWKIWFYPKKIWFIYVCMYVFIYLFPPANSIIWSG